MQPAGGAAPDRGDALSKCSSSGSLGSCIFFPTFQTIEHYRPPSLKIYRASTPEILHQQTAPRKPQHASPYQREIKRHDAQRRTPPPLNGRAPATASPFAQLATRDPDRFGSGARQQSRPATASCSASCPTCASVPSCAPPSQTGRTSPVAAVKPPSHFLSRARPVSAGPIQQRKQLSQSSSEPGLVFRISRPLSAGMSGAASAARIKTRPSSAAVSGRHAGTSGGQASRDSELDTWTVDSLPASATAGSPSHVPASRSIGSRARLQRMKADLLMHPQPRSSSKFGFPPRCIAPGAPASASVPSIPPVRRMVPPRDREQNVPSRSEGEWHKRVNLYLEHEDGLADEWLQSSAKHPHATDQMLDRSPSPGSERSSPPSSPSLSPESMAARRAWEHSQIEHGAEIEKVLRRENEEMDALLEQHQKVIAPEEVDAVAKTAAASQAEYNELRRRAAAAEMQLAALKASFASLDPFNPEAPQLPPQMAPPNHEERWRAEAEAEYEANVGVSGVSGGASGVSGVSFSGSANGGGISGSGGPHPYALAASVVGEENLMRRGAVSTPAIEKLLAVARKVEPSAAQHMSSLISELDETYGLVEEAEATEQVLLHMEKQITKLHAGVEISAKSRGDECNEEGSRLDLAQKDLTKAYKQQYDAETGLEATRTRTELRSAEMSGQLSELTQMRELSNILLKKGGGDVEHPLLAKLEAVANSRKERAGALSKMRDRVAEAFVDETRMQQTQAERAKLQEGFEKAAKVLNIREENLEARVAKVVEAAKQPDQTMALRRTELETRKADLLVQLEEVQQALLQTMPYAGYVDASAAVLPECAAADAPTAAVLASSTSPTALRAGGASSATGCSMEAVGRASAAPDEVDVYTAVTSAAIDDAMDVREEARRAAVARLDSLSLREENARSMYTFYLGVLQKMHTALDCTASTVLHSIQRADRERKEERKRNRAAAKAAKAAGRPTQRQARGRSKSSSGRSSPVRGDPVGPDEASISGGAGGDAGGGESGSDAFGAASKADIEITNLDLLAVLHPPTPPRSSPNPKRPSTAPHPLLQGQPLPSMLDTESTLLRDSPVRFSKDGGVSVHSAQSVYCAQSVHSAQPGLAGVPQRRKRDAPDPLTLHTGGASSALSGLTGTLETLMAAVSPLERRGLLRPSILDTQRIPYLELAFAGPVPPPSEAPPSSSFLSSHAPTPVTTLAPPPRAAAPPTSAAVVSPAAAPAEEGLAMRDSCRGNQALAHELSELGLAPGRELSTAISRVEAKAQVANGSAPMPAPPALGARSSSMVMKTSMRSLPVGAHAPDSATAHSLRHSFVGAGSPAETTPAVSVHTSPEGRGSLRASVLASASAVPISREEMKAESGEAVTKALRARRIQERSAKLAKVDLEQRQRSSKASASSVAGRASYAKLLQAASASPSSFHVHLAVRQAAARDKEREAHDAALLQLYMERPLV